MGRNRVDPVCVMVNAVRKSACYGHRRVLKTVRSAKSTSSSLGAGKPRDVLADVTGFVFFTGVHREEA